MKIKKLLKKMKKLKPRDVCEIVLGAGMAVLYREDGYFEFVVLDGYDREITVNGADLDKGWREDLMHALVASHRHD